MPESHGGIRLQECIQLGIDPAQIIDFSVNSNPFGPPDGLKDSLLCLDVRQYPDPDCYSLKQALSEVNHVAEDNIIVGNGSVELIWSCARAFVKPGDTALVVTPTFGEYQNALDLVQAKTVEFALDIDNSQINVDQLNKRIKQIKPRLTFICNPNNPTGHLYSESLIEHIAALCDSVNGMLIVDEAYRAFAGLSQFGSHTGDNVLILRSMTKDFAIPSLRLGYALGSKSNIEKIASQIPPWNVSSVAQNAGEFLLENRDATRASINKTRTLSEAFKNSLNHYAVNPLPSMTHYFLLNVGDATKVRKQLLHSGLLVRDCTSFNLPNHIRVSTRLTDQNNKLVSVLSKLVA